MNESNPQNASLLQSIQEQGQQLKEQLEAMHQAVTQMNMTVGSLQSVEKQKKEDILIPLGSGCFLKGKSTDKEKVIIDLGPNVLAEKPIKEAVKLVTERKQGIEKQITIIEGQLKTLDSKAQAILKKSN
ncbi:MAG: prefoldin subunit alpha [Candidatus Diapherotrites archaeon]|nr:prefoldin subunit alpha [Candidatus Diapherotrites archaeon]